MAVKVREVIAELEEDGWVEVLPRRPGGHRQFKHPTKLGRVTVSGPYGDDLAPGTLASVRRQSGLPRLGRP